MSDDSNEPKKKFSGSFGHALTVLICISICAGLVMFFAPAEWRPLIIGVAAWLAFVLSSWLRRVVVALALFAVAIGLGALLAQQAGISSPIHVTLPSQQALRAALPDVKVHWPPKQYPNQDAAPEDQQEQTAEQDQSAEQDQTATQEEPAQQTASSSTAAASSSTASSATPAADASTPSPRPITTVLPSTPVVQIRPEVKAGADPATLAVVQRGPAFGSWLAYSLWVESLGLTPEQQEWRGLRDGLAESRATDADTATRRTAMLKLGNVSIDSQGYPEGANDEADAKVRALFNTFQEFEQ